MATLTAEQIKQVLTLVMDQPGFRSDLINAPATTLTGIGIPYDPSDIPQLPDEVILPSDAVIRDRLDELTEKVLAHGCASVVRQLLQLDED